ncbi:MAG: acetate--CoA ligase family protein [Alphaproteobacteria bacterium]
MRPRSVAIIGASLREMSAGWRVLRNLRTTGFKGAVYPVNPRYDDIAGLRCYPSVGQLPEVPDAAFIGIPAEQVAGILEELGAAGTRAAVCNASGFADGGPDGIERQRMMVEICTRYGIKLCGPNNTGFLNLVDNSSISTWPRMPNLRCGPVALLTHSGSLAIAFGQEENDIGLAYVVTAGNEAVCAAADYLDFIVRDPRVKVVSLHLEAIRKPELFIAACEEAARRGIRVVALKVGESDAARASIAAHTGSLVGDDRATDAFLRRCGAVRVRDLDEFAETTRLFAEVHERPRTRHIAAMTFSGGQAGLIADITERIGLSVPQFSPATIDKLRAGFPPFGTPRNPIDAWGLGWDDDRFNAMVAAPVEDANMAALAICVDLPRGGGADTFIFDVALPIIAPLVGKSGRILFINNMTGAGFNQAMLEKLKAAGIPVLRGLQAGLLALKHWTEARAPKPPPPIPESVHAAARAAIGAACMAESERVALLQSAGVPMASCRRVDSGAQARSVAAELGYPVVLKGTAPDLPHKTELGLVRLGLANAAELDRAYAEISRTLEEAAKGQDGACVVLQPMVGRGIELIVGIRNDLEFGSLLAVGLGGTLVEILDEVAVSLAPVDSAEARAMLERTKAARLIRGVRGAGPFDLDAAADAIAAISRFGAAARDTLVSLEVNPLIVGIKGALGVDVAMSVKSP